MSTIFSRIAPWQAGAIVATIVVSALAVTIHQMSVTPTVVFMVAAIATIGLAWMVGLSTEQLAATSGPKASALLNAAFGNIAELVLVLIAVSKGLTDVAIASIAGSVIGNALFVLGAAFLWMCVDVMRTESPAKAIRLFTFSITYITLLFGVMAADVIIRNGW